ncbi:hypothetical protein DYB32_006530 [Aphanomyces invadans]|uniref:Peroxin-5 n=1 Tax=Aphanomyces invadans TaxID=157072 RepID=A0A3R7CY23_9STRA|nr:hypothetical protein DYB32_006530 [Aphanomyces invadans]
MEPQSLVNLHQPSQEVQATQAVEEAAATSRPDSSVTQRVSRDVANTLRQNSDPRFQNSEFVQFMDALGSGRAELDDAGNTVIHHDPVDTDELADALKRDLTMGGDADGLDVNALVGWSISTAQSERRDLQEEIWAKAMQEGQMLDPFEGTWSSAHDPANATYEFAESNPYTSDSNAFEVVGGPDVAGLCCGQPDEVSAVEEDPYNLDALLALGVSNVNELKSHGALTILQSWVQHNPKFHGLQVELDDAYGDGSLMDEVMQLMLQAQAYDPHDSDYEDAAHCYLQALQQNDQADHIWSYLRIAFTCMERFDLVKLTDIKDVGAFRSEFNLLTL